VTPPAIVEPTRSAHWGWEEHRYFGYRVFAELAGKQSLTGLVALSTLGRALPPECCGVLDDAAGALTMADPRIWPLKLTRVAAAYGGMVPALAAGMLMQNEARIGPWAFLEAAEALLAFERTLGASSAEPAHVHEAVVKHLAQHRFVWGFGTPYRQRDERLVAFRVCMQRRGRDRLPYWTLMEAIASAVGKERSVEPNMGIALAAALLDMGLTPREVGALVIGLMQHMFFAHAVEGVNVREPVLRKLPDAYVTYRGPAPRTSPRAVRSESLSLSVSATALDPARGADRTV
jgi:hypothetical protein